MDRLTSVSPTVSSGSESISRDTHSNCLKCAYHRNRCFVGFFSLFLVVSLFGELLFAPAQKRTLSPKSQPSFVLCFTSSGGCQQSHDGSVQVSFKYLCHGGCTLLPDGLGSLRHFSSSTPAPYSLFLVGDRRPGEEERVLSHWPLPHV